MKQDSDSGKWYVERVNPPSLPGRASDFIWHLEELMADRPGLRVVLYCRVSERYQKWIGNLDCQLAALRRDVDGLGIQVVECVQERGSGWVVDCEPRPDFERAVQLAADHDAVIVAATMNRFIRNRRYHSVDNPDAVPTEKEFFKLMEMTPGVELATLLHPDALPGDVRSFETERGMLEKGGRGGRPEKKTPGYKTRRRERLIEKARWMRATGSPLREIAEELQIPFKTIDRWLKRAD